MQSIDLSGISVLIVECNPLLRTVFRQVLRELGVADVNAVGDIDAGFAAFELGNPDIILLDWCPNCDGLALLKRIRHDPKSANPFVPVIITSAYGEIAAVAQARDLGMSEYLAKPVSAQSLYERISLALANGRSFVRATAFFGPDRRRHAQESLLGGKRNSDSYAA